MANGENEYRTWSCLHRQDDPKGDSAIVRDFKVLNQTGHSDATTKAIEMLDQLRELGMDCPNRKHLGGPLYELKSRVPSGGVRVYFARLNEREFVVGRAECKKEDQADMNLLNWFAEVLKDIKAGRTDLLR